MKKLPKMDIEPPRPPKQVKSDLPDDVLRKAASPAHQRTQVAVAGVQKGRGRPKKDKGPVVGTSLEMPEDVYLGTANAKARLTVQLGRAVSAEEIIIEACRLCGLGEMSRVQGIISAEIDLPEDVFLAIEAAKTKANFKLGTNVSTIDIIIEACRKLGLGDVSQSQGLIDL